MRKRPTWSATAIASDLGERRELVFQICMDQDAFLTGFVDYAGAEPQLDEDAIEEVKETIAKLRKSPNGIEDYMGQHSNSRCDPITQ